MSEAKNSETQARETAPLAPPAGTPPRSYLARYFDGGLEVSEDLNEKAIIQGEIDRLTGVLIVVIHAGSLPRRLGDVTDEDLALDKKRARRTTWALTQALRAWSRRLPTLEVDAESRVAGAQLVWEQFKAEHAAALNERMRLISTWALMNDSQIFGKKAVVKLNNELNWVDYALRD